MRTISDCAGKFVQARGQLDIEHLNHKASLYQENMDSLFDAEFTPALYRTGTSRGNGGNRRLAYEHALAQKAAYNLHSNAHPEQYVHTDTSQIEASFERAYDVCPWLPSCGKVSKDIN